jgi:phosphoglycolate phosphatase-like HAD superfamily hydrolase
MLIKESNKTKIQLLQLLATSAFRRNIFKVKLSQTCQGINLNPTVNLGVVEYIEKNKKANTKVFLATAAEYNSAVAIVKNIYKFDGIIGSDNNINNKGLRKLRSIQRIAKDATFTYIGDSKSDLAIWRKSEKSVCVEDRKITIFLARVLRIKLEVI